MQDLRKLATLFAADAVGYSRLMAENEKETLATLTAYREVFVSGIRSHHGRVVDTAGDSVLAIFDSPVEAVECATEIQNELSRRNRDLIDQRRMLFRIGLNLGDVITRDDGTVYGDAVNIAARLQSIAPPGAVCISANVHEQVEKRTSFSYVFIGEQQVKNIEKPIKAYQVQVHGALSPSPRQASSLSRKLKIGLAAICVIMAALGALWSKGILTWPASPTTHSPQHTERPSIAVLPFTNMSGDATQDYMSDGLAEDIITALSRFTKMSVVARNSTFVYKNKAVDIRQVGKDLGVRYVLEGSMRRTADRVRITAQLIDASDGKHLWAENYDRDLKDLLRVQDEVIQQIVGRLDVELDRALLEASKRTAPKEINAYDLTLRARKLIYDHSEANHRESRDLLERAVALDDQLAQAHIELAWIYLDEYRFKWNARPQPLERALKAALRAVELEPNNGFAHWRLAKIRFFRKELDQFDAEKEKALSLNSNHAETLGDVAVHLAVLDRTVEGYPYALKAIKADPQLTWVYFPIAGYHYRQQHYREALAATYQMGMPDFFWTRFWRAICHAQLGEVDAAQREAMELKRLKPDFVYREQALLWNSADSYISHVSEGARKAGIPVLAGEAFRDVR